MRPTPEESGRPDHATSTSPLAALTHQRLDSVNAYLAKAYPEGPLDGAEDAETYVSNPLNALGMMWRHVSESNFR